MKRISFNKCACNTKQKSWSSHFQPWMQETQIWISCEWRLHRANQFVCSKKIILNRK